MFKRIQRFDNVNVEWYKNNGILFVDDPETGEQLAVFKVKISY